MSLMSENAAYYTLSTTDAHTAAKAHAVAREQHRRDVERVRALIEHEERELQSRPVIGTHEHARLDGMHAVLAALEATK